jgi:photosystem II stability/assembly factor-like uncharacterized protein
MATIKSLVPAALLLLLGGGAQSKSADGPRAGGNERSCYAAVFLNRGRVSGGQTNYVGLFKRIPGDTTWVNMYHNNLLTFGMGSWERGTTIRRYLAMGNGLHRSDDGGKTWRVLTSWQTEEVLSVAPDPVDSALIYIGTPFGVFKSTDNGAHWQKKVQGMKKWFVKKVMIDRTNRSTLYATGEDDLYRTTDGGEHWKSMNVGATGLEAAVQDPSDVNHLLIGSDVDAVHVSFNGGKSWIRGKGLPEEAFYAVCVSPDKQRVYAGGYKTGLWKSDDGGASWEPLWKDNDIEAIFTLYIQPGDPKHLMMGTSGQGVFESFDEGKTWTYAGLKGCHVKQIEFYP